VSKTSRHPAIKASASANSAAVDAVADADQDEALKRALAELWAAISAGDVLSAEIQTAAFVAMPQLTDSSPEEMTMLADALIDAALEHHSGGESAAFFRLLISLGSRSIKREASQALAELTKDGTYPPSWVTSIGKPVPRRAWRVSDVFGDRESIVVTFRTRISRSTVPLSCLCRSPGPASAACRRMIPAGSSRTRPLTAPPPSTNFSAARRGLASTMPIPRDSGRRCSPVTAAEFPASHPPRSGRSSSPPRCSCTSRARSPSPTHSTTACGQR